MEKGKLGILSNRLILLAYKDFRVKLKHVSRIVKATRTFFCTALRDPLTRIRTGLNNPEKRLAGTGIGQSERRGNSTE
jgi:hypothetical protein